MLISISRLPCLLWASCRFGLLTDKVEKKHRERNAFNHVGHNLAIASYFALEDTR